MLPDPWSSSSKLEKEAWLMEGLLGLSECLYVLGTDQIAQSNLWAIFKISP